MNIRCVKCIKVINTLCSLLLVTNFFALEFGGCVWASTSSMALYLVLLYLLTSWCPFWPAGPCFPTLLGYRGPKLSHKLLVFGNVRDKGCHPPSPFPDPDPFSSLPSSPYHTFLDLFLSAQDCACPISSCSPTRLPPFLLSLDDTHLKDGRCDCPLLCLTECSSHLLQFIWILSRTLDSMALW